MREGPGDGAVLTDKAILEGANNFIIDGVCTSRLNPLHLELRDIDKYQIVNEIIKDKLKI